MTKSTTRAEGACVCGAVRFEIGVPARWAWHDHSAASRHAHGAAYATYVGSYRSRFRYLEGEELVTQFVDAEAATTRSFCSRCGAPVAFERHRARTMINIPRALFESGTGREPRYHLSIDQVPDWAYGGGRLVPLKGFPGVVWERPTRSKSRAKVG